MRLSVEDERLAEHGGIGAEPGLPRLVGEHDDRRLRGDLRFLICEDPALRGRRAEESQVARGDEHAEDAIRRVAAGEIHALPAKDTHVVEGAILRPPVDVVRVHDAVAALCALDAPDGDHAVAVRIGQRTKQDGVHHREDRRVRADAERQRERGDDRECRPAHESPGGELEILNDDIHVVSRVVRRRECVDVELVRRAPLRCGECPLRGRCADEIGEQRHAFARHMKSGDSAGRACVRVTLARELEHLVAETGTKRLRINQHRNACAALEHRCLAHHAIPVS